MTIALTPRLASWFTMIPSGWPSIARSRSRMAARSKESERLLSNSTCTTVMSFPSAARNHAGPELGVAGYGLRRGRDGPGRVERAQRARRRPQFARAGDDPVDGRDGPGPTEAVALAGDAGHRQVRAERAVDVLEPLLALDAGEKRLGRRRPLHRERDPACAEPGDDLLHRRRHARLEGRAVELVGVTARRDAVEPVGDVGRHRDRGPAVEFEEAANACV